MNYEPNVQNFGKILNLHNGKKVWILLILLFDVFYWLHCFWIVYIGKITLLIPSQGSTYLFEVPSWRFILSQPYSGWINMKVYTVDQQIFLVHRPMYFWKYWKKLFAEITIPQVQLASICLNSATLTIE